MRSIELRIATSYFTMNEKLVIRVIAGLFFRFLHLLLMIESDIYGLILRLFDRHSHENEVEVLSIFARFQFDSTEVTRETDFLSFHDRTSLFEEICEEGWFIYSITEQYIYFVRISPVNGDSIDETISIENCPKLSSFLFLKAEKLARVHVDTFHRVSKSLPEFRSTVVLLHSAPCSGGTEVSRLLQACDNSRLSLLAIGEPPVLTHLSLMWNHVSIEEMRNLCNSTLLFSMINQKPNQTIVFKARSSCTKIAQSIYAELPSIKNVFISRRNYNDVISRLVIETSIQFPLFSFLCSLRAHHRWLSHIVSSWSSLEAEITRLVGPKTDVEFAMAQVYGSVLNYKRKSQFYVPESPFVEDIISDTVVTMRPLLAVCEISDLAIPECIEWKRKSEDLLREVWKSVELSSDDSERVHELVRILQEEMYSE